MELVFLSIACKQIQISKMEFNTFFSLVRINILKIHICALPGGSEGLFAQKTLEITDNILATYKNQGTSGLYSYICW